MIEYNYEIDFRLDNEAYFTDWISRIVGVEECLLGDVSFIFCDDEYLLEINKKYLDHDTYTDVISFDYTSGSFLSGDIFISVERVRDNATKYEVEFKEEVLRVMAHGILHLIGYKDKADDDIKIMRGKEKEMIELFHVEH